MEEGKEGTLDMLIKNDGSQKKKEGKLNEAEKVERKLEPGSTLEKKKKVLRVVLHDTNGFSFAADVQAATAGMKGVKENDPSAVRHAACNAGNEKNKSSR